MYPGGALEEEESLSVMESTLGKEIERIGNINQKEQAAYEVAQLRPGPDQGYGNNATSFFHRLKEGRVVMVSGSVRFARL